MKLLSTLFATACLLLGLSAEAASAQTVGMENVDINIPDLKQAEQFFSDALGCVPVTRIGPFELDGVAAADPAKFAPRADSVKLAMVRCGKGSNIELFEYTIRKVIWQYPGRKIWAPRISRSTPMT
jgi:hypothetical protein